MAWDDEKQVAPGTEEGELTPDEWNEHVADQKGHSGRHESGGIDELTVEGLSGDLADAQDPKAEVTRDIVDAFFDGGTNVTVTRDADTLTIDTTALNDQEVADKIGDVVEGGSQTTVTYDSGTQTATITIDAPTQAAFDDHSTRHESGGGDELSVTGLSGDLADEQDAKPHDIGGETHTADTLANLNSKVSDATLDDTADPREPEAHAATHEGGSDSLNVFDLTGDLVGEGLERVNDTLQVLSSIWDGANVVADVNNTNTTTESLEAGSVNTEKATINGVRADNNLELVGFVNQTATDTINETLATIDISSGKFYELYVSWDFDDVGAIDLKIEGLPEDGYDYLTKNISTGTITEINNDDKYRLVEEPSGGREGGGHWTLETNSRVGIWGDGHNRQTDTEILQNNHAILKPAASPDVDIIGTDPGEITLMAALYERTTIGEL